MKDKRNGLVNLISIWNVPRVVPVLLDMVERPDKTFSIYISTGFPWPVSTWKTTTTHSNSGETHCRRERKPIITSYWQKKDNSDRKLLLGFKDDYSYNLKTKTMTQWLHKWQILGSGPGAQDPSLFFFAKLKPEESRKNFFPSRAPSFRSWSPGKWTSLTSLSESATVQNPT